MLKIRVETKCLEDIVAMAARGIGRHFDLPPLGGQVQAGFPEFGSQENVETLAPQFQVQVSQIGEVAQGARDVIQRLGFSLGSRIAPTGIGLDACQFF
jgi:hypothetical protein